jgi:AAA15 family ATPase/GTPase
MADLIVSDLKIENFKSIKSLALKPKRINLFIGKPNTGKSNILEALSLFCLPLHNMVGNFARYEKFSHLFYDQDVKNTIRVEVKISTLPPHQSILGEICFLKSEYQFNYKLTENNGKTITTLMDGQMRLTTQNGNLSLGGGFHGNLSSYFPPYKKYEFRKQSSLPSDKDILHLQVPFGENIFYVLETHPELFEEVARFFTQYGLDLVLNQENDTMLTQKKKGNRVFQLPYSLVADTLQRMIFYLAAIKTNKESVLIFEEPEAHSFPPYVQDLANAIVDSTENQFFIATHSPYLFNTILEEAPKEEVAVFITEFEDYQTVVYEMTEEQLSEMMDYGIEIFYNLKRFTEKETTIAQ